MNPREDLTAEFYTEPLTKNVRAALEEGAFPTYDPDRWEAFLRDTEKDGKMLAKLECPAIDIELEMWCADGTDYDEADNGENGINLSYLFCIKFGDGDNDWETHGSACADGIEPNVDLLSPTWEQDLREEMQRALEEYAEKHGLSLTDVKANANAA